jgi:hypothetical protein
LNVKKEGGRKLVRCYPFRMIRSSRAMLNCQRCLDLGQGGTFATAVIPDDPKDQTRNLEIPGSLRVPE